jgi:hypothetical protein
MNNERHVALGLEVPKLPLSLVLRALEPFCYVEGCMRVEGGFDREGCEACFLVKAFRRGRESGYVLGWYDHGRYERGDLNKSG